MAGVQGPGRFWAFNAEIYILPHSRDSFSLFLTSTSTPKDDKNGTLDCTSINLRYSIYISENFSSLNSEK